MLFKTKLSSQGLLGRGAQGNCPRFPHPLYPALHIQAYATLWYHLSSPGVRVMLPFACVLFVNSVPCTIVFVCCDAYNVFMHYGNVFVLTNFRGASTRQL